MTLVVILIIVPLVIVIVIAQNGDDFQQMSTLFHLNLATFEYRRQLPPILARAGESREHPREVEVFRDDPIILGYNEFPVGNLPSRDKAKGFGPRSSNYRLYIPSTGGLLL